MRSRHIAHSVNPFEQVKLGLLLSKNKKEIIGIEILSIKLSYLDIEGVETFLRLVIIAEKHIRKKAKEFKEKVLELSKKIPLKSIPKEISLKIIIPHPNDVKKDRK